MCLSFFQKDAQESFFFACCSISHIKEEDSIDGQMHQ